MGWPTTSDGKAEVLDRLERWRRRGESYAPHPPDYERFETEGQSLLRHSDPHRQMSPSRRLRRRHGPTRPASWASGGCGFVQVPVLMVLAFELQSAASSMMAAVRHSVSPAASA